MEIIAVATDAEVLRLITEQLSSAAVKHSTDFYDPMLAIKHIFNNIVDYAFIQADISRPLNVAQIVSLMRKKQPKMNIYLITDLANTSGRISVGENGFISLPTDKKTLRDLFSNNSLF